MPGAAKGTALYVKMQALDGDVNVLRNSEHSRRVLCYHIDVH